MYNIFRICIIFFQHKYNCIKIIEDIYSFVYVLMTDDTFIQKYYIISETHSKFATTEKDKFLSKLIKMLLVEHKYLLKYQKWFN